MAGMSGLDFVWIDIPIGICSAAVYDIPRNVGAVGA